MVSVQALILMSRGPARQRDRTAKSKRQPKGQTAENPRCPAEHCHSSINRSRGSNSTALAVAVNRVKSEGAIFGAVRA